jgi:hypothetical protein
MWAPCCRVCVLNSWRARKRFWVDQARSRKGRQPPVVVRSWAQPKRGSHFAASGAGSVGAMDEEPNSASRSKLKSPCARLSTFGADQR